MNKGQEIAIQQALNFIRTNLSEELAIPEIAKKVGYSASYLRHVFQRATGKGVLAHIHEMRMERARNLLCDTRMSISEIAFAAGLGSYKRFHRIFLKRFGCSPGEFRKSQGLSSDAGSKTVREEGPEARWYYEPFNGPSWNKAFEVRSGTWKQEPGFFSGVFEADGFISFREPLPENFRVQFEVRLIPEPALSSAEVCVGLQNITTGEFYCQLALGRYDGAVGDFRPRGFGSQLNPQAVCERGIWNKIELVLEDDTVRLSINGREMFVYKDPFPLPFSHRSNILIGGYNGRVQIREFEVFDRGFLSLIRNVRSGDSLYNAGFTAAARDYYMRLLTSKISTIDSMELRYKIGQCFLAEANWVQARSWLEKVISLPETGFWAQQASLGLLEVSLAEERNDGLPQLFQNLFRHPTLRNGAREIVEKVCSDYERRGFFERSLILRSMLSQMETFEAIPAINAKANLAECLYQSRRYKESEEMFREALAAPGLPGAHGINIMLSLCNSLTLQGKFDYLAALLAEIESRSRNQPILLCRIQILRALVFRASGEFEKALSCLAELHTKYAPATNWRVIGSLYSTLMYVALGKSDAARKMIQNAKEIDAHHPWLTVGNRSWSHYPIEMVDGNLDAAAKYLFDDFVADTGSIYGAEYGIKAGILLTLAGKEAEAREAWAKVSERFIETRFHCVGTFAESLSKRNIVDVDNLPLTADRFAEILYLLGLLAAYWGQKELSVTLFNRCVAEDPLLGWPAYFAKKRIEEFRQDVRDLRD